MKAFPHKGKITINETVCGTGMMSAGQRTVETDEPGMDLRDYFAAKAMQGFLSNSHLAKKHPKDRFELSTLCYHLADAMMKARAE